MSKKVGPKGLSSVPGGPPTAAAPGEPTAAAGPAIAPSTVAAPAPAVTTEAESDAFLRDQVMVFPATRTPLDKPARQSRARVLLQAMRASSGESMFGVSLTEGLDAASSLKGYYATVDAMAALAQAFPGARATLRRFRDEQLSIPTDQKATLELAVGDVGSLAAPAQPLGTEHMDAAEAEQALATLTTQGKADNRIFRADDSTVELLREQIADLSKELAQTPKWLKTQKGGPGFVEQLLRLLARSRELGNGELQAPQNWPHLTAGMDATHAPTVARLALAVNEPFENIVFSSTGQNLGELFPPEQGDGYGELGDQVFSDFTTWRGLLQQENPLALSINDASLKALMRSRESDPSLLEPALTSDAPAIQLGALALAARLLELGIDPGIKRGPAQLPRVDHSPRADAAFWRLALAQQPRTAAAAYQDWRKDGYANRSSNLAGVQLGNVSMPSPQLLSGAIRTQHPGLFQLDNPSLKQLFRISGVVQSLASASDAKDWSAAPAWHAGVLRLLSQARRLSLVTDKELTTYVTHDMPQALLQEPFFLPALGAFLEQNPGVRLPPELTSAPALVQARWSASMTRGGPFAPVDARHQSPWPLPYDAARLPPPPRARELETLASTVDDLSLARALIRESRSTASSRIRDGVPAVLSPLFPWLEELQDNAEGVQQVLSGVKNYLTQAPLSPSLLVSDSALTLTVRLAQLAHVPLDDIQVGTDAASRPFIDAVTQARLFKVAPEGAQRRGPLLADLDPARTPAGPEADRQRLTQVRKLLGKSPALGSFTELLTDLRAARLEGRIAPLSTAALTAPERAALADELVGDFGHLAAGPVLGGLLVQLPQESWSQALTRAGFDMARADRYAECAAQLSTLSGESLSFALEGLDQSDRTLGLVLDNLPLRVRLASGSAAWLSDYTLPQDADIVGAVRSVLERAALEPDGSADRDAAVGFVNNLVSSGRVHRELVNTAVRPEILTRVSPDHGEVARAVSAVLEAPSNARTPALKQLVASVRAGSAFASDSVRVKSAVEQLWKGDLLRVEPLAEADEALGGVPGKRSGATVNLPPGVTVKSIEGALIPLYPLDPALQHLVPTAEMVPLVMLDSMHETYQALVTAAAAGSPFELKGPPGVAKTSLVMKFALDTNSAFLEVGCTNQTRAEDFVGSMAQGTGQFTMAELDAMPEDQLRRVAVDYRLDLLGMTSEALRTELKFRQDHAHFQLGPVAFGALVGGKVLLDESQVSEPEARNRIQNILQEHGYLTLSQFRKEPIRGRPGFAIFAANNPSDTAGRLAANRAEKSRWKTKSVPAYSEADFTKVMKGKFGSSIPEPELAKLVKVHHRLAEKAATGRLGRDIGGLLLTPRDIISVGNRFQHFRGTMKDEALMRRETEEVYLCGLHDEEERKLVVDVLDAAMQHSEDFYQDLKVREEEDSYTIGDITVPRLNLDHPEVPGAGEAMVETPRVLRLMYLWEKAALLGENPLAVGDRASGKTQMTKAIAHRRGQPHYQQDFSDRTTTGELVGEYDETGWHYGLLARSMDPDAPGIYLGDEANVVETQVLERFNSVTDFRRRLTVFEHQGEVIRRPASHVVSFAINPATREYSGRKKMSSASLNRMRIIHFPLYDQKELRIISEQISRKAGLDPRLGGALAELQTWAQTEVTKGNLQARVRAADKMEFSLRSTKSGILQISAQMKLGMDQISAYRMAINTSFAGSPDPEDNRRIKLKADQLARIGK